MIPPTTAPAAPSPGAPVVPPASDAPVLHPPLPGPPDRQGLIIERPDLQPRRDRLIYGTITAVAWVLWAYLWLPLVTLVAWYFGVRAFIREVAIPDRLTLLTTGASYLLVVLLLGGGLLVWSRYNLRRFGGKDRRAASTPLRREEMEAWFSIPASLLDLMRHEGSVVVEHDGAGKVERVKVSATGPEAGPVPVHAAAQAPS